MNLKTGIPVGRLWNKQIVLREFLNSPLKKVALCKSYGGEKWKKYYNDITKWSLTDPEFREAYESYMKKNDPDRDTKNLGGRPPVEAPEDWKEQFCLDLIKYNGNKSLASRNSPYSFKTILQKLNPDYQLADKELIEMVKTTELEIAARIEAVIVAAILSGACLGFYWFNAYPAEIFMGDVGSLSLGATLAMLAIMTRQEMLLPIVGGLFVAEAMSVILQIASIKLRGKRILKMAPLHHHFEMIGWKETKVTTRFHIVTLMLSLLGAICLKLR